MKVIVFLLAACLALASAGPNPFRKAQDVKELENVLQRTAKSQFAMQSRAEKAAAESVEAQQAQNGTGTGTELPHYMSGRTIYIYGKAPVSGSFNIDLIPYYYDAYATDVIALRLTVDVDQYHVTRNSYAHDKWLYEDNEGYSGIQPRRFFSIVIVVQTYSYEISINGYHFATYYHRVPYTKNMKIVIDQSIHSDPIEYY